MTLMDVDHLELTSSVAQAKWNMFANGATGATEAAGATGATGATGAFAQTRADTRADNASVSNWGYWGD